jgi:DNA-binding MarR family transcriptional regulator
MKQKQSFTLEKVLADSDLADFGRSIWQLVRRLRAMKASQGVTWSQSSVMKRLAVDGPATTADLARAEAMTPQSMRTIVAALEAADIVRRRPHPTDGRQVHIELTAKGAAVRQSNREALWGWLAGAVAELDDSERETLFAAGKIIKRLAES